MAGHWFASVARCHSSLSEERAKRAMDAVGSRRGISAILTALGIMPAAGTALYAGRIVHESTFGTWQAGPLMIGYGMAHSDAAILWLLAPLLALLWVIAVVVVAVYRRTS